MCGLLVTSGEHASKDAVIRANAQVAFRGPDACGYRAIGDIQLAHNRLKIFDLSDDGNQPMVSRSGKHVIVYNGEIYNFPELAKQFDLQLRTKCDTEVVVELFELLGPAMLTHFNGMFALVIVNTETGDLFAARDRLGIKPLYWVDDAQGVCFCSELAPLKELLPSVTPDSFALRQYKKLRACFNGRTLYNEINVFPAGHYCLDGKFTRYWQLPEGPQAPPADEELAELVSSAVAYRMRSDVPVGAYLSGGLDSSILVALAGNVETYTVGSHDSNEFDWAGRVAAHLGIPLNCLTVTGSEYRQTLDAMVNIRQEPLSVPNEVLIHLMSKEVKKKNTVVLSGEGADELFFGYDRIFRWAAMSPWNLEEFARLYSYSAHEDLEVVEDAIAPFVNPTDCLETVARFFQIAHLHGLLRRLDFATMLASVEARVPFVDHRLVERMAGVPLEYRMADGIVKAPLKRIFGGLLPEDVVTRQKIGFPVDLAKMLGQPGATYDDFFSRNLDLLNHEDHRP